MRILIISDSHGKTENILKLKQKIGKIDLAIHCGDGTEDFDFISDFLKCKICGVSGNCDLFTRELSVVNLNIEGKRIHIEHGNKLPVHSEKALIEYARNNGFDLLLYGHTHIQKILHEDGVWVVNPGSISKPHDGWPSYIILETDGKGGLDFKAERL